jgi:hypothetical protein
MRDDTSPPSSQRSLQDLLVKYRTYERHAALEGGTAPTERLYGIIRRDLEEVLASQTNAMLTLDEAEAESGLGKKHLVRLADAGTIKSEGANRSRKIQRGSLLAYVAQSPRHREAPSTGVAVSESAAYDPNADARRIAQQLGSSFRGGR